MKLVAVAFSPEMRCFITEHYFKAEPYESVQRFKNCFEDEYVLPNSATKRTVNRFKKVFAVDDYKQNGRPVTANLVEKQEVCALLQTNTQTSVCKLAQAIHNSVSSTHNILTSSLKLHAYHISVRQKLKPMHYASGHTVHCLRHDSISGPAIGPFFSMFTFERCFFHFGKSRAMKGVIFFSFSKF